MTDDQRKLFAEILQKEMYTSDRSETILNDLIEYLLGRRR